MIRLHKLDLDFYVHLKKLIKIRHADALNVKIHPARTGDWRGPGGTSLPPKVRQNQIEHGNGLFL